MSNKTTNVYWAPMFSDNPTTLEINWGILYPDPKSLYDELRPRMTDSEPRKNMFYCPAFKNLTSNTFVVKNPMKADFKICEDKIISRTKNFITPTLSHPPSIKDSILMHYAVRMILFAEDDDINMSLTSPFFDTPNHLKYGNICPGKFSISNWFRSVNAEFNLKPGIDEIIIEKDEPLFYLNFDTDKKVNLIRFDMNHYLQNLSYTCGRSSDWESWIPLVDRYKRFRESRMRQSALREIKKNLVV